MTAIVPGPDDDRAKLWPETPIAAVLAADPDRLAQSPRAMDALEERLLGAGPTRVRQGPRSLLIALGTCLALLGIWYALPNMGLVNPLLLPDPIQVAKGLWDLIEAGFLPRHIKVTLKEVGLGFAIGASAGFLLGTMLAVSPFLRQVLSPYIVALQSLPKVVLAPLIIGWLGFGVESKVATAVAICFFPLMINTSVGLTLPAAESMKLMRSLGASRWQVYRKLRLPTAAPLIFVGIKHAALLAFTGALVAEILVGSSEGLGRLVAVYNQQIRMELAFAVVVVVAAMAVAAVMLFDYLDRKLIFWREDKAETR